jgi:hypothetical protein
MVALFRKAAQYMRPGYVAGGAKVTLRAMCPEVKSDAILDTDGAFQ